MSLAHCSNVLLPCFSVIILYLPLEGEYCETIWSDPRAGMEVSGRGGGYPHQVAELWPSVPQFNADGTPVLDRT